MPDEIKLIAAIDAAEATALGGDQSGDLSTERALALRAFAGENIEPAPEGRSQVTDWTVFETIQWILPSLTRIFANGDNIVEFAPFGPEDEEAAEQESEYLNYLVTQKNNWFLTLLTWFQDALLTKNAYCLAYLEEKLSTESSLYKGQSEEALALLLDEDGVEVVEGSNYPDPDDEGSYVDAASGQEISPEFVELAPLQGIEVQFIPPRTLYDVRTRKVTPTKKLQFRVLPPENCLVGEDTPDHTTENCNYFEYFEDVTISSLRSQGFDIDDDIASDDDDESEEQSARDKYEEEFGGSDSPDPSMRIVRARHIWIRFDYDEDGIAELQYIVRVGQEILSREEASRIPVASIVPFINTHRHIGASVADLTFDIQRIKTALLRGGLDSLYLSQNPRNVISDKVHLDDLLVSRPGAPVRLREGAIPGEGHVMPLITEFTLPQTLQGLQHMDTVVESRVGVNRIFQGIDDSALNDHNRIGQLSTMAAQRVEQIARIFANGVEYLFSLAHEIIIKSGHQSETTKLRGQWVTIDPSQWRTGRDMRVVAPFAAGNKDTLVARLMMIAQVQEKALMSGLPIVTPDDAYNTAIELVKASDFSAPEKFFTDPKMIPPKEPPPDYTMIALDIENKKADNSARDSETDAQVASAKSQSDTEIEKYKADLDAQVKKYQTDRNSELQVALAQLKAGQSVDLERVRANLKISPIEGEGGPIPVGDAFGAVTRALGETMSKLDETIRAVSADKEIVRDEMGKVTGTKLKAVK